jgi:1-deoxy-D-xylulose-5-phosphate synthase
MDVLHRTDRPDVLLVAVGVMAPVCLQAAELLQARGIRCTVVDPRWVKPVDPALPALAAEHRLVAVVEDNSRAAGVGSAVALTLGDAEVDVPLRRFGIPEQFLAHGKRGELLADIGLTPVEVAGRISASLAVQEQTGTLAGPAGAVPEQAGAFVPAQEPAAAVPAAVKEKTG